MSSMTEMSYKSKDESLCEKSMQVVINIIKLSSFQTPSLFSGKIVTGKRVSDTAVGGRQAKKKNMKSQKVQKPAGVSYLIEPAVEEKDYNMNNTSAAYVIHNAPEKENVDGRASDYIKSVYEKIHLKSSSDNIPRFSAYMKKSPRHPRLP